MRGQPDEVLRVVVIALLSMGLGLMLGVGLMKADANTPDEYATQHVTVGDLHWVCLTNHEKVVSCALPDPWGE